MNESKEKFWNKEIFNYAGYPLTRVEIVKELKNQGFDDNKIDSILSHNTKNKDYIGNINELKNDETFKYLREIAAKELNIELEGVN